MNTQTREETAVTRWRVRRRFCKHSDKGRAHYDKMEGKRREETAMISCNKMEGKKKIL